MGEGKEKERRNGETGMGRNIANRDFPSPESRNPRPPEPLKRKRNCKYPNKTQQALHPAFMHP